MGFLGSHPKLLIVEGHDDKHSVIGLMKSQIDWPDSRDEWPVYIEVGKSVSEILDPTYLRVQIKNPKVKSMGIIIDGDSKPAIRYGHLLKTCKPFFPRMPDSITPSGVVVVNDDNQRLGVWIMPDNSSEGCLETFLCDLIPDNSEKLWQYAAEVVIASRGIGATYRDAHTTKASLYTWLAWQDPPGQSPGIALTKKILFTKSPVAEPFVGWFRKLFEL